MPNHLIPPHGGTLVDLLVDADRASELKEASRSWPSWDLTPRQLCDLELLVTGAFSPLTGFLGKPDHEHVLSDMRLADGTLWPIPVTLDVSEEIAGQLSPGSRLALRDAEGVLLGVLQVEDVWQPDREAEAQAVFGTTDAEHPGVAHLLRRVHPWYVSGRVEGLHLPPHYDFRRRRRTPAEIRRQFAKVGWSKVVAFQTRTPIHRAEYELMTRAAKEVQASLLVHPFVGLTKPGDLDHYARMRCYKALLSRFPKNTASLVLLPLAMRLAGPREALWNAIIEKNFGCTHIIVGRDHAGPGKPRNGHRFYRPYEALEFAKRYEKEVGVGVVAGTPLVYLPDEDLYVPEDDATLGARSLSISSVELRARLADGRERTRDSGVVHIP
jgi:sulfate adenylyltransferase